MIKVVLWDIDGTLLSFKKSQSAALHKAFAEFGLGECDPERTERYSKTNERYWEMLETGDITRKELFTARFRDFFAAEGIDFTDYAAFNACYHGHLGEVTVPYDNSPAILAALRGRVKQYIVTNGTPDTQARKLTASGIDKLVDGVFVSEDLGAEKPSPVFFDKVFAAIDPVDRTEVLIVGDSLTGDMRGGINAGIHCCWYNPEGKPNFLGLKLDYEIRDLHEVSNIVENEEMLAHREAVLEAEKSRLRGEPTYTEEEVAREMETLFDAYKE